MKSAVHRSMLHELESAAIRTVIYPLWAKRDHPHYARYFREFQESQFFSSEQIRDLQLVRLRRLMKHAYDNCPFYRGRMDEASLRPSAIESLDDLKKLPVLTKRDIQDHGSLMLARNIPESARVPNQTGGSTGSPLQFFVDKERFDSRMASTDRHNRWAGLRPGDWHAYLWGARLDRMIHGGLKDLFRNHLLYRRLELNTSSVTSDNCNVLIAQLRKVRPRFMIAYAKSAVLLAKYIRDQGIDDVRFDSVITTAEVLFEEDSRFLEQVFDCQVFNRYGCRELSVIASECEHHRMHVNADALLLEILPVDNRSNCAGKVVITDLLNLSMPLIRYEIGDVAEWGAQRECPCGRGLPLLENVQGRTTDFLELADGKRISGPALTLVVADMPDVRQVQFVQHAISEISLRVVPGKGYGEHTKSELRRRLSHYLGSIVDLTIEETTDISSELSGKYRFVISHLQKPIISHSEASR